MCMNIHRMHEDTNAFPGKIARAVALPPTCAPSAPPPRADPTSSSSSTSPTPSPAADEVLVRVAAAGVNFIDTYRRAGVYRMPFPHVVGSEGAGEVVGASATTSPRSRVGDRVAWSSAPAPTPSWSPCRRPTRCPSPTGVDRPGRRRAPAAGPHGALPGDLDVPGRRPGHDVLVHAAAGGVGLLLTQLAVARGARVIATVGSAGEGGARPRGRRRGRHPLPRARRPDRRPARPRCAR